MNRVNHADNLIGMGIGHIKYREIRKPSASGSDNDVTLHIRFDFSDPDLLIAVHRFL